MDSAHLKWPLKDNFDFFGLDITITTAAFPSSWILRQAQSRGVPFGSIPQKQTEAKRKKMYTFEEPLPYFNVW
jgi:hypothetical protein